MAKSVVDTIDDLLPQTQCTKCGFAGCRPYAEAIASGAADINQCPPGGQDGIRRLAALLGREVKALNPTNGVEKPLALASIDEHLCIGCTLCIQACPVDAIVGAAKRMHTVLLEHCTGCELCVPPCPVDCIAMLPIEDLIQRGATVSEGGPPPYRSRERHHAHNERLLGDNEDSEKRLPTKTDGEARRLPESESNADLARKRATIAAALDRARARRAIAQGE
jgi:electron transport complex protein RnfB